MKSKAKILKEIEYCQKGVKDCEEQDSLIYQGWVEALEWVVSGKGGGYR